MEEVLKLTRMRALLELIGNLDALATEAALMAQDLSRFGDVSSAEALWKIAHRHRARMILCQAQYEALRIVGMDGSQPSPISIVTWCVQAEADTIEVALKDVIPLALAVTEAISNAFKHAFPEATGGRLDVSAQSGVEGYEVVVRDNGRGRPANLSVSERGTSMGSHLIQTFAAQIDGTVSYENDSGTVFRIRVPIKQSSL